MPKPLIKSDESGFYFAQEMLAGDSTAGINFDRLQFHPERGYIVFEYLLCEAKYMTPFTSHPNKYWRNGPRKFLSLWRATRDLCGHLFLVNYAKSGTEHEDKILVIKVKNMDDNGITEEKTKQMTRKEFSDWFRKLNKECLYGAK